MADPEDLRGGELELLRRIIARQDRANARNWAIRDQLLHLLADIGESGMGVALTLLVDGHLVVGVCGSSMDYAEQTAASLGRAMESAAIEADVVEQVTASLVELDGYAREREQKLRETVERYGADSAIDDIAATDIADFYHAFAERTTVDLREVTIYPAGGSEPIKVGMMRVRYDSISAWWPTEIQEGATVNYARAATD